MKGEIRGTTKGCSFHDYHVSVGIWFHFLMTWSTGANNFGVYNNGGWHNKRNCWSPGDNSQHNHVYTLGADESLAGNSNRDLDVSYDDLVILFSTASADEIRSPSNVARGMVIMKVVMMVINVVVVW